MLKKDLLESQVALELPAREMMQTFGANLSGVWVNQANLNAQLGLLNINAGQANGAAVTVGQIVAGS